MKISKKNDGKFFPPTVIQGAIAQTIIIVPYNTGYYNPSSSKQCNKLGRVSLESFIQ